MLKASSYNDCAKIIKATNSAKFHEYANLAIDLY